jgi:alkylhydroperoxidase family enzyme
MTWLKDLPAGNDDWQRLSQFLPAQMASLADFHEAIWDNAPDPVLLELCRRRMAEMLGCAPALRVVNQKAAQAGLTAEKASAVSNWPGSPLFSEKERRWLAFTEQFIGDVNGITDELFEPLLDYSSPEECSQMVYSLWPLEQIMRITAVLGLDNSPEPAWLGA